VDILTYDSKVYLRGEGEGSVINFPLATGVGAECASSEPRKYSGDIEWQMVSDGEASLTVDGVIVNLRVKGSFGALDWSTIYFNSCTNDPDLGGWIEFIGGTGA